jgi:hypothetical protein
MIQREKKKMDTQFQTPTKQRWTQRCPQEYSKRRNLASKHWEFHRDVTRHGQQKHTRGNQEVLRHQKKKKTKKTETN